MKISVLLAAERLTRNRPRRTGFRPQSFTTNRRRRGAWRLTARRGTFGMVSRFARLFIVGLAGVFAASPAVAFDNPLERGALADFLTLFREQAIPKQVVTWRHPQYKKGTVVISTKERRLYFVLGEGQAIEYGVGVGRQGFTWSGTKTITRKREWPDWRPPAPMLRRRPDLPRYMAGGMENPLGARALYLGSSEYRIHGSNEPDTIGAAVSSGCIRMTNNDVIDLYGRVKVGTKVVVLR
jgi:hypothetical protein